MSFEDIFNALTNEQKLYISNNYTNSIWGDYNNIINSTVNVAILGFYEMLQLQASNEMPNEMKTFSSKFVEEEEFIDDELVLLHRVPYIEVQKEVIPEEELKIIFNNVPYYKRMILKDITTQIIERRSTSHMLVKMELAAAKSAAYHIFYINGSWKGNKNDIFVYIRHFAISMLYSIWLLAKKYNKVLRYGDLLQYHTRQEKLGTREEAKCLPSCLVESIRQQKVKEENESMKTKESKAKSSGQESESTTSNVERNYNPNPTPFNAVEEQNVQGFVIKNKKRTRDSKISVDVTKAIKTENSMSIQLSIEISLDEELG